jgi:hypothetical protein
MESSVSTPFKTMGHRLGYTDWFLVDTAEPHARIIAGMAAPLRTQRGDGAGLVHGVDHDLDPLLGPIGQASSALVRGSR